MTLTDQNLNACNAINPDWDGKEDTLAKYSCVRDLGHSGPHCDGYDEY